MMRWAGALLDAYSDWKAVAMYEQHPIQPSDLADELMQEKEIKKARFLTEIRAGITTFFTMAYIISVNAAVLTDSGASCVCNDSKDPTCTNDPAYNQCLLEVNRDLVTATAAIAALTSCLFGFLTNMPVAFAPGMGLNAYFAYQVVGFHGTGPVSYGVALAAVFIEGWIFLLLSLLGMRQWLVKLIPTSIKLASGAGIGLLLSLIGLSGSAGIGAVSASSNDPLALAGCPAEYMDEFGECTSHQMRSPTMWLGIFGGGILTAYLMSFRVKSAFIIGILLVSIISWPRDTAVTYFPHTANGDSMFDFFKQVACFRPIQHTLNAIDWQVLQAPGQFVLALFTFLYVDILDCTGTLYSMARFCGVVDPDSGDFPRSTLAYCTDAFSISIGSLFGTSSVTAFIESGAGIAEGGKTGLTSITTGLCFFIAVFFAPIFASIPPYATGCTLVLVGCMMAKQIGAINWRYVGDAVPAFVTLIFMPFSYSIAYGLIAGLMTYIALNTLIHLTKLVSGGRLIPFDEDYRDYWTYKPGGNPPWFIRLIQDRSILPRRELKEASLHSQFAEEPIKNAGGEFSGTSHEQWTHEKEFGRSHVETRQLSELASLRNLRNGSYKITNGTWPADPAYYDGRFSNGPVWVENVASNLSIPLYDRAVGGATTSNQLVQGFTGPNSSVPVPSIADQVDAFLADKNHAGLSSALVVVLGGLNDIFFNATIEASQSIEAIFASINRLRGATSFLTLNYYNASRIPYDHYTSPLNRAQLSHYSASLGALLSTISSLESHIAYVDLTPLFADFDYYGDPTNYGFNEYAAYYSCLTGAYGETPQRTLCKEEDKAVFWDEYHPTAHVHRLIAEEALAAINKVF
ncbi:MAG: hypothetical protein M1821_005935 [Bathelium mastoideum]|nr:MAG: hypothetical protein M1821_005935 [Bathelium mastoideum]